MRAPQVETRISSERYEDTPQTLLATRPDLKMAHAIFNTSVRGASSVEDTPQKKKADSAFFLEDSSARLKYKNKINLNNPPGRII